MNEIAFISQLSCEEKQLWLTHLSELLPEINLCLAENMTDHQKLSCQIAIIANPLASEVESFKNLKWCQSLWAGVDSLSTLFNINTNKECNHSLSHIKVSRLIDPQLSQTMSEAVLTWVLYFHREMHRYKMQQDQSLWLQHDYTMANERQVGILGLGELGRSCAERLMGNGFQVSGWSRHQKNLSGVDCFFGETGLIELAKRCDIIVCLLPLTPDTRGLINSEFIKNLPDNPCLINFARGAIINNDDLIAALTSGQLEHAVLDVFEEEPLESNSRFWHHKKITVLPHISAPTHRVSASKIVANNINNYLNLEVLPPCVDFKKGY